MTLFLMTCPRAIFFLHFFGIKNLVKFNKTLATLDNKKVILNFFIKSGEILHRKQNTRQNFNLKMSLTGSKASHLATCTSTKHAHSSDAHIIIFHMSRTHWSSLSQIFVPKSSTNVKVSSKPTNGRQLVMQSCTGDLRKEWMDFAEVQGLPSEKP